MTPEEVIAELRSVARALTEISDGLPDSQALNLLIEQQRLCKATNVLAAIEESRVIRCGEGEGVIGGRKVKLKQPLLRDRGLPFFYDADSMGARVLVMYNGAVSVGDDPLYRATPITEAP